MSFTEEYKEVYEKAAKGEISVEEFYRFVVEQNKKGKCACGGKCMCNSMVRCGGEGE